MRRCLPLATGLTSGPVATRSGYLECGKSFGELWGLQALKTDGKYLKGFDSAYLAFAGLGMGDGAAVDIAEESHRGVLSEAGALLPSEDMNYHQLFPLSTSGYTEGVMIDDHVGCQLGPYNNEWQQHGVGRDREVFEAADAAYVRVGLEGNTKKRVRRSLVCTTWGAELEGDTG